MSPRNQQPVDLFMKRNQIVHKDISVMAALRTYRLRQLHKQLMRYDEFQNVGIFSLRLKHHDAEILQKYRRHDVGARSKTGCRKIYFALRIGTMSRYATSL